MMVKTPAKKGNRKPKAKHAEPKNIDRIIVEDKEIILVGTAHISKESAKLVRDTIEKEKPDAVGVELCKKRHDTIADKKKWEDTKITQIIKEGKTYLFLTNLLLSSFQKRLGKDLEIRPGQEMIEAIEAGKKTSAHIVLLDRDIQVTLKRAWKEMGFFEKFRLTSSLVSDLIDPEEIEEEMIEKLKEKDMLTELLEELGKQIPSAKKVLIDERDIYIANKILASPGKKIVAVVGAGHIEGIKRHLKKREDITPLEKIPDGSKWTKVISYGIPLALVGIIAYGFIVKGSSILALQMLGSWFLINAILSALGVLLALGHPLTIIAAFVSAPFTAIHPAISVGMVAGLVEAKIREPRVKDFQDLSEITSIKGFYTNRVSRILLVASLSNLGGTIGTFISLPYLLSLLK